MSQKHDRRWQTLLLAGVALLAAISVVNAVQTSSLAATARERLAQAAEEARPARISVTTIRETCEECTGLTQEEATLAAAKVNITSETTAQASEAARLGVERLPAMIITGELDKATTLASRLHARKVGDRLIVEPQQPPYVDAATGETKGLVSATLIIPDDCPDCQDLETLVEQLKAAGVRFKDIEGLNQAQAASLIDRYGLTQLPALIMDDELQGYSAIVEAWPQLGTQEDDGSFVTRKTAPPYYGLEEQRKVGDVDVVYLQCDGCYDAMTYHGPILRNLGVRLASERNATAKDFLVEKYNITKLPAIVMTGDMDAYPSLVNAWGPVGSVEDDGAYVFRKPSLAQKPYRDEGVLRT